MWMPLVDIEVREFLDLAAAEEKAVLWSLERARHVATAEVVEEIQYCIARVLALNNGIT